MKKRSSSYVLLAHCCLDQNAVVSGWERAAGAYPFVQILLQQGIGVLQLPCPEMLALGPDRPPMTFEEYNTPAHRDFCRALCDVTVSMVRAHKKGGDRLLGIIGIQESPNCALRDRRGVFMEALCAALEKEGPPLRMLEVPVSYEEGNAAQEASFSSALTRWIEEGFFHA